MRITGPRPTALLLGTAGALALGWALGPLGPDAALTAAVAAPAPGPAGAAPPVPAAAPRATPPLPPPAAGRPAPLVHTFAARPAAPPLPPLPSPARPHRIPANVDGCDRNYGTRSQCIPWTFPQGVTAKCEWLRAHNFANLRVVGTDRHKIDRDRNGVACDD